MITVRKNDDRGHFDFGWLNTRHTFSFGEYFDKEHMGFRSLRVINEDEVAPGKGFGRHPHQDMEIISYVLDGALRHEDSLGHGETLLPGEVQRMTAGTGIEHSEFNPSRDKPVHFLQIWIRPEKRGLKPGYEQKKFAALANGSHAGNGKGTLTLVASPDGAAGSLTLNTDARLYVGRVNVGEAVELPLAEGRHAWVQVTRGDVSVNGQRLEQGDGAAVSGEAKVVVEDLAAVEAEVLVFDLA
jgi:redox-sensitive bicupin YhaK (pirin superfamily)